MGLLYNITSRADLQKKDAPKQWYCVIKSRGIIEKDNFTRHLAATSGIPAPTCGAVLESLAPVILEFLRDGNTIEIPGLGNFYVTANGVGVEKQEDVSASQIKNINIRFQSKESAQVMVNRTTLTRSSSLSNANDGLDPGGGEAEDPTV